MKIVKLSAENVKRLTAVEITPEGTLVTIGGKNGAGKSSVLDAIAYALGGQTLIPVEPIRQGEEEAKIEVDLGDYIVIRKFRREKIDTTVKGGEPSFTWGPTKSTLVVRNKDGASFPSPQALLDKLLGKLTFDPLAFARMDARAQDGTLRQLVGVDTTILDAQARATTQERTDLNRQYKTAAEKVKLLPFHTDAPSAEIALSDISKEMLEAEQLRQSAADKKRAVGECDSRMENLKQLIGADRERMDQLREMLENAERNLQKHQATLQEEAKNRATLEIAALEAERAIPDTAELKKRLSEAEDTNRQVRANQQHYAAAAERDRLLIAVNQLTSKLNAIAVTKRNMLESVKFPVSGLGFSDEGVTFNGVPFSQASTAEQLRVSVAIGLALNPKLVVLLVRDGNALDSASLRQMAEQAKEAGAQVWLERVAEEKNEGVSVMIEDGHVI